MPFDPTKPFEVEGARAPVAFDPAKPFEVEAAEEPSATREFAHEVARGVAAMPIAGGGAVADTFNRAAQSLYELGALGARKMGADSVADFMGGAAQAGASMRADNARHADDATRGTYTGPVAGVAGQVGATAAQTLVSAPATFALMGHGAVSDELAAHGVAPEDRGGVGIIGAPLGFVEALPLGRLAKLIPGKFAGGVVRHVVGAALGEGLEEGVQQVGQNAIVRATELEPNRPLTQDVVQNMIVGAAAGGAMGVGAAAMLPSGRSVADANEQRLAAVNGEPTAPVVVPDAPTAPAPVVETPAAPVAETPAPVATPTAPPDFDPSKPFTLEPGEPLAPAVKPEADSAKEPQASPVVAVVTQEQVDAVRERMRALSEKAFAFEQRANRTSKPGYNRRDDSMRAAAAKMREEWSQLSAEWMLALNPEWNTEANMDDFARHAAKFKSHVLAESPAARRFAAESIKESAPLAPEAPAAPIAPEAPRVNPGELFDTGDTFNLASLTVSDEEAKLKERWAREDATASEPVLPGTEEAAGRAAPATAPEVAPSPSAAPAPEVKPEQRLLDAAKVLKERINNPSVARMVSGLEKAIAAGDAVEVFAFGREVVLTASRHDGMSDVLEAAQRARADILMEPEKTPAPRPRDPIEAADMRVLNADLTPKWKRYGHKTLNAIIDSLDPDAPLNAPTLRDVAPALADAADRHGVDAADWYDSAAEFRARAADAEARAADMAHRGPSILERVNRGELMLPSKSSFAGEIKALREMFGARKVKVVEVESVAAGDAHLARLAQSLTVDEGFSEMESNVGDLLDALDRAGQGQHDRPTWAGAMAELPYMPATKAKRTGGGSPLTSREGAAPESPLKTGPVPVPAQEFERITGGAKMAFPDEAVPLDALALGGVIRELQGVDGLVRVRRKLRMRGALGTFSPMGRIITLKADLFRKGRTQDLVHVVSHELGHLVDFMPEGTLKRGNLGGRILSVRDFLKTTFPVEKANPNAAMTAEERADIRAAVEADMAKVASGPVADVLVAREAYDRTFGRTNKALSDALGVEIPKGKRLELKAAYHAARDRAGKLWTDWLAAKAEESAKRIEAEMHARGYDKVSTVRAELIEWTQKLSPYEREHASPSYISYRESGEELYAEAVSGVFAYPESLAETAPLFWRAFWGHLDAKPAVRDAYLGALAEMRGTPSERAAILSKRFRGGVAQGAQILSDYLAEKARKPSVREWWHGLVTGAQRSFTDRKHAGRTTKNTGLVDRLEYSDAMKRAWVQKLMRGVYEPLKAAGVDPVEFGEYLAMRRIAQGDRSEFANPHFHSPESAGVQLFEIMARQTEQGRRAMRDAEMGVRVLWEEIQERMVSSGLYSREFIEELRAKAGDAYVPFAVVEHFDGRVGAGVQAVSGTVGDIADPLVALALKAGSAIDAAAMNQGKVELTEGLRENGFFAMPNGIEVAEVAGRDGKGRPFYGKPPMGKKLVEMRVKGEPVAYWMPHAVAETFDRMTPVSANAVVASMRWIFANVLRRVFIVDNPGFQYVVGPFLDMSASVIKMPTVGGKAFVAKEIVRNLASRTLGMPVSEVGQASRDFIDGRKSRLSDRLQELGGIPPPEELFTVRTHEDGGVDALTGMEDLLRSQKLQPTIKEVEPGYGAAGVKLVRFLQNQVERTGATNESVVKLAAFKYAVDKLGWPEDKAAEFVLRYIGIPDSRRGGSAARIASAFFPFANTSVQGVTSMAHMFAGAKEFSTIGLKGMPSPRKVAAYTLLTYASTYGAIKLFGALAEAGLLGDDLEEFYARLSEYDRAGTVIPVGVVEGAEGQRKSVVLRVPVDPLAQFLGELVRNAVLSSVGKRGVTDAGGAAFASGKRMLPGMDPTLKTAGIWSEYWAGRNPQDDFRNRPVLSPQAEAARSVDGMPAFTEMLEQTGGNFGVWSHRPDDGGERTMLEKVSRLPIVSRVLTVTNAGVTEKAKRDLSLSRAADAVQRLELPEPVLRLRTEYSGFAALKKTYEERAARDALSADEWKTIERGVALGVWHRSYSKLESALLASGSERERARIRREIVNLSEPYYKRLLND